MSPRTGPGQRRRVRLVSTLWRRAHGQSIVEFALILPLFLVLVFGIIEFGRAYIVYVTVTNAAREGARLGVTGASASAIQTRAQTLAGPFGSGLTVSVSYVNNAGVDQQVQVDTSYTLSLITPVGALIHLLPGGVSPSSTYTISATARMHME